MILFSCTTMKARRIVINLIEALSVRHNDKLNEIYIFEQLSVFFVLIDQSEEIVKFI